MLGFLIAFPWLALVPAIIFALLYWRSKSRLTAVTSLAWFMYLIYEYGMYLRILCSGECNIRVDLLLIYPILLILSTSVTVKEILKLKKQNK